MDETTTDDGGIIDVESSARMDGEPGTTFGGKAAEILHEARSSYISGTTSRAKCCCRILPAPGFGTFRTERRGEEQVAAAGRVLMAGLPLRPFLSAATTASATATARSGSRASQTSDTGKRDSAYRPRRHGMVYNSSYKSQPSFGFGRAKRPCCEKGTHAPIFPPCSLPFLPCPFSFPLSPFFFLLSPFSLPLPLPLPSPLSTLPPPLALLATGSSWNVCVKSHVVCSACISCHSRYIVVAAY